MCEENEKKVYYCTEVEYTDSREGDLRSTVVITEGDDDGLMIAMKEDYYFGSIISCETREAYDWEVEEYGVSKDW